jgi:hypothetical protein
MVRPTDFKRVVGSINRDGILGPDDGWAHYHDPDSATLYLGDTSPPSSWANREPVVGLFQYRDAQPLSPNRFAVTADTVGHLYECVAGNTWTHRAFTAGSAAITGDETALVQFAFHSPGDFMVFTNDDDVVYQYPCNTAANTYTDFNQAAGPPDPSHSTLDFGAVNYSFKARSIESFNGRLVFLNTEEAGVDYPRRLRGTNVAAEPNLDPAATPAGAFIQDYDRIKGEGVCVKALGQQLALYFSDGVAFAYPTLQPTAPFRRHYVSTTRGLLGTHSVVDVGGGRHFGIFTDGFFFLDTTGQWIEAGVRTIQGRRAHKWHQTFYQQLDWDSRNRVVCIYDISRRLVRISWPDEDMEQGEAPNRIWNYHIDTDTMWEDDYGDMRVNIWGEFDDEEGDVVWNDMLTDTWSTTWSSWASLSGKVGISRIVHGTTDGLVVGHNPGLVQRDGPEIPSTPDTPTYLIESHQLDLDVPTGVKTTDKLHVHYRRVEGLGGVDPPQISVQVENNHGDQVDTNINQTKGTHDTDHVDFAAGRVAGERLGFRVSGSHPAKIIGFQVDYDIEGTEEMRED